MKELIKKSFRVVIVTALLVGAVCFSPASLQARVKNNISVDVVVNVHGSDIAVSTDVMEDAVEKLLRTAAIKVVDESADKGVVRLQIDIYKDDDGFRVDCDWDDDPEPEIQKRAETQDQIDDIVEEEVDQFIEFIKNA